MNNKIEKHKNSINKILNNHIKNAYKSILYLLEHEKDNGKLTIDEFKELKEYLNQKYEEMQKNVEVKNTENIENVEENIEETRINSNIETEELLFNEFKQSLKVEEKELKFRPIYKGEIGRVAPERSKE